MVIKVITALAQLVQSICIDEWPKATQALCAPPLHGRLPAEATAQMKIKHLKTAYLLSLILIVLSPIVAHAKDAVDPAWFKSLDFLLYCPKPSLDTKVLEARANEIHSVLSKFAQTRRTTAVLSTNVCTIVSSGGRDISGKQRKVLRVGEIVAREKKLHAEVKALRKAKKWGLVPKALGVSRKICPNCTAFIIKSGGRLTSPTTAVW